MKALFSIVFLKLFVGVVFAHDPGLSAATIDVMEERVDVTIRYAPSDLKFLSEPLREIARVQKEGHLLMSLGPPSRVDSPETVEFRSSFLHPGVSKVTFQSTLLGLLPRGHRQAVTVRDRAGVTTASLLLSAQQDSAEITLSRLVDDPRGESLPPAWGGFIALGIRHIWTGYDHLLFLVALLLTCPRPRAALILITCFTAAHSVTLALATFEVVQLPSRWVESVIAASIIYVAVENVTSRTELRGRALLTFGFGLIHGLGFASALREVGVGSGLAAVVPLLSFNVGVEIGQITIAALVLSFFLQLRTYPVFLRRGVPALSALIASAGAYWLIERTLGAGLPGQ